MTLETQTEPKHKTLCQEGQGKVMYVCSLFVVTFQL